MIKEIWKEVKEFESAYEISNLGKVKSLKRFKKHWKGGLSIVHEKILKMSINSKGYFNVDLSCDEKYLKSVDVHRLVALHFIPNPENKPYVNHIDGNKQNNNVSNLEWSTASENTKHAFKIGLMKNDVGEKSKNVKLTEKEVLEIRASNLMNTELGRIYNIHSTMISKIKLRRSWTHI